jgi:GR25 family glycosyltransferase involved in LPS biosynthesis
MKITIVGPGIMDIPPKGWGAVEILIWDTAKALEELGHEVQIINTKDVNEIVEKVNDFEPDFVHIHYDEFIDIYNYFDGPRAITSHFGYLEQPDKYGSYSNIAYKFNRNRPNIFCLSPGIIDIYSSSFSYPEEKLFLTPNGVDTSKFSYSLTPMYPDRSIYLAKIDYRKRQHLFQGIDSLYYAGNVADINFNTDKNYLGEWDKETLYSELTEYGNLVLLSDGEAHPLVCMEALSAGLGLVLCEYATANLDTSKPFITVIPEDKITDIEYIESEIIKNREYSISHREEIKQYSRQFDWKIVLLQYYIPAVEMIIAREEELNSSIEFPIDTNKAAYKLNGLPPIYYINLDGQPQRQTYMENQFKYWGIENYERLSAYDGRVDDLGHLIVGRYPTDMTSGEIGCVTSHLKAIKHWLDTSDSEIAMFMEDDIDLQTASYWNFTWQDFISNIPYNWDCVQLAVICTGPLHANLHRRFINDFSTACYILNRDYAKKLIKYHIRGDRYKLDNGVKPRPVADDLIYNSGNTYAVPLFLYRISLGSTIHPEHVDAFHKQNYYGVLNFWQTQGAELDVYRITDYNPYSNMVSEASKDS